MDTPQGKMGPSPPKIGADSLKMAKVPWELTPQVTFFACPCMVDTHIAEMSASSSGTRKSIGEKVQNVQYPNSTCTPCICYVWH